jgi:hypothetical protein
MSTPPKRPKRPTDLNQLAKRLVDEATGKVPEPEADTRDPHAVALGAKGASKGGQARASRLTPEERKEIAKRAASRRWGAQQG